MTISSSWRTLAGISQLVSSSLGTEEVLQAICRGAAEVMGVPWARLWLVEEGGKALRLAATFGPVSLAEHPELPQVERIKISEGFAGQILATGRPVYSADVQSDPRWVNSELARRFGWRAALSHPIWVEGEFAGTLAIISTEAGTLGPEWEESLGLFCNLAGVALRNARAYARARRMAERLEALESLSRQVAGSLEARDVLQAVVRAACELLGGVGSRIGLLDEETGLLRTTAWFGEVPESPSTKDRRPDLGLRGVIFRTGKPLVVPDLQRDERSVQREWVRKHGLHAYIGVPLHQEGKVCGVLRCYGRTPGQFTEEDVPLLQGLAHMASVALGNADLYERVKRQRDLLGGLVAAARTITAESALSRVLERIVEESMPLMGADRCRLMRWDPDAQKPATLLSHGLSAEYMERHDKLGWYWASREEHQAGKPWVVPDVEADPRGEALRALYRREGIRAYAGFPLLYKGEFIGNLTFFFDRPRELRPEEVALGQAFAEQAAIAFQNARLHEEERRSRNFLRSVVNDNADAIIITDLKRKITHWNAGAERLYGYAQAEVLGRDLQFIAPKHRRSSKRAEGALRSGKSVRSQTYRLRKDGAAVPVSITISPVKDDDGKVIAHAAIHKDLTDRVRAEEKLKSSHDQLRRLSAHLQSAREEERSSIAREIHDELGQGLTGLKLQISWLRRTLSKKSGAATPIATVTDKLASLSALVDDSVQTVRRISSQLRPEVLDSLGLTAAIEWQAGQFQKWTGIKCTATFRPEDITLDKYRATALFRILQEALTNVARHANASSVSISLREDKSSLLLLVRDNGKGIERSERSNRESLGLVGMRERARLAGGAFQIEGNSGKGTTVSLRIPLADSKSSDEDK